MALYFGGIQIKKYIQNIFTLFNFLISATNNLFIGSPKGIYRNENLSLCMVIPRLEFIHIILEHKIWCDRNILLIDHRVCVPFHQPIISMLISFPFKVVHRLNVSIQILHFNTSKIGFSFSITFHGFSYIYFFKRFNIHLLIFKNHIQDIKSKSPMNLCI